MTGMLLRLNDAEGCNEAPDAPRTIAVFGCGRGGTSATAGVLRALGVAFPDGTHPLKHESSPLRYEGGVLDRAASREEIARLDARHRVWGWKSPGDLFSVGSWISMLRAPRFLVVFRNPLDTIRSIVRHEGVPPELAAAHVGEVTAELGRFLSLTPFPVAVLSYEALCGASARMVAEIADWAGLGPDTATLRAAAEFVARGTRGYRPLDAAESQEIDAGELASDRMAAQQAMFSEMSGRLRGHADALAADIVLARNVVSNLAAARGAGAAAERERDIAAPPIEPSPHGRLEATDLRGAYEHARARHRATLRERMRLQARIDELACRRG